MSERILTLFGEEVVMPEPAKPVGKSRAKKTKEKAEDDPAEEKQQQQEGNEPIAEYEIAETAEQATDSSAETAKAPREPKPPTNLPEDWQGDKQYYSIGEVAALFNVRTSHIRFWTNEFKLKVRTTRKGDRLYTPEQIREIRAIHHLVKERGFTLTGAKAKLKAQNKMDVETVDLKQSLLQLRNKLIIIKNQLNA